MVSQDLLFAAIPRMQQPRPIARDKMTVHHLEKRPVVLRDEKERNAYEQEEEITYVNALRERMKEEQEFNEEKNKHQSSPAPQGKKKLADVVEQSQGDPASQHTEGSGGEDDPPPSGRHLDLFV